MNDSFCKKCNSPMFLDNCPKCSNKFEITNLFKFQSKHELSEIRFVNLSWWKNLPLYASIVVILLACWFLLSFFIDFIYFSIVLKYIIVFCLTSILILVFAPYSMRKRIVYYINEKRLQIFPPPFIIPPPKIISGTLFKEELNKIDSVRKINRDANKKREIVYIFSNPSMPELIKIGRTNRSVEERLKELNNTSLPTQFSVEYIIETSDSKYLEKLIHKNFDEHRVNDNREFFRIHPKIVFEYAISINNSLN